MSADSCPLPFCSSCLSLHSHLGHLFHQVSASHVTHFELLYFRLGRLLGLAHSTAKVSLETTQHAHTHTHILMSSCLIFHWQNNNYKILSSQPRLK